MIVILSEDAAGYALLLTPVILSEASAALADAESKDPYSLHLYLTCARFPARPSKVEC